MELIPLKIPMGYAICYNKFCDVEPKVSIEGDGYLENWHYFTEDILQIIKIELKDGSWYVPEDISLVIDLGWYQDGKIDGNYRLVLARVKKDDYSWNVLREKISRDRFEIRDTIEAWMKNLESVNYY